MASSLRLLEIMYQKHLKQKKALLLLMELRLQIGIPLQILLLLMAIRWKVNGL